MGLEPTTLGLEVLRASNCAIKALLGSEGKKESLLKFVKKR